MSDTSLTLEQNDAIVADNYGPNHIEKHEQRQFEAWSRQFSQTMAGAPTEQTTQTNAPTEQTPDETTGRSLGEEIGVGVTQIPRGALHGAAEAFKEAMNLGQSAYNWFWGDLMGFEDPTGFERFAQSEFGITDETDLETFSQRMQESAVEIVPQPDAPDTVIGNFTSKASQFITGFVGAGRLLRAAQPVTTAGKVAKATAQGAIADFSVFDPYEERLSNMLSDAVSGSPEVQKIVDDYLVSNQSDDEFTARLKSTAEGAALGAAVDGFVAGVRALRGWRKGKPEQAVDDVMNATGIDNRDWVSIGDPTDDKLLRQRRPSGTRKVMEAMGRVPDEPVGDVYVNWSRIDEPDDIRTIIQDMADRGKTDIETAARGKRTFKQIQLDANSENAWEALLSRRRGDPMNAEQSLAARNLWAASGRKLAEVSEEAARNPSDANLFQFRKMMGVHHAIQQEVLAARRETARALAQWRIPASGGGVENMRAVDDILTDAGGQKLTREMAARMASLARAGMIEEFESVASKAATTRTWEAFQQVWINGLLSGPHTHVVNALSNAGVVYQQMFERGVAAQMSSFLGTDGGVVAKEMAAQWAGMTGAIKDGARYSWKSMRTNQSGFGLGKIEVGRGGALSADTWNLPADSMVGRTADALDTFTSLPGRAMTAADEFFKTIGYRMELNAQAARRASQEVANGSITEDQMKDRMAEIINNPPEDIRLTSIDAAMYQTFTRKAGPLAHWVSSGAAKFPFLRVIVPFINTPANLFSYAFERSPMAPVVGQWRADIAAGGARGDLAATRMATGSMFMLGIADLAMSGRISGAGPADPSERAALRRSGWQNYSFKIGDRWFSYRRLDPIGMEMGLAADMVDILVNGDFSEDLAEDTEYAVAAVAASIANNIMSKSYMSGLTEFFTAMGDPDKPWAAERYLQRLAGSAIPTGVAHTARAMDPTAKDARGVVDTLRNRIPLLNEDLPKSRDLWGRERRYESGLGSVYDIMSPIYSRRENPEPIDKEIIDQGFSVSMPGRKQVFRPGGYPSTGVTIDLDQYEGAYSRLMEIRGTIHMPIMGYGERNVLEILNEAVDPDSGQWWAAQYRLRTDGPEGTKEDYVQDTLNDFMNAAKDQLLLEYPDLAAEVQFRAAESVREKRGF